MWVARDKNGDLNLYATKPSRNICAEEFMPEIANYFMRIDENLCPNLTWEDEPIEVELSLKEIK